MTPKSLKQLESEEKRQTKRDETRRFMYKLASDCLTYGLSPDEAVKYFRIESQKKNMSDRTVRRWIEEFGKDTSVTGWMNEFTRIGFVKFQRDKMDGLQKILDYSFRRFFSEIVKPKEERNDFLIIKLQQEIRQTTDLLNQFATGTPMMAAHKKRLKEKGIIDR